ncbi:MAG: hypothetical protein Q7V05_07160 [Methanoregula sp.]|nr:hypothetical protein [Methanoregula sp.]
MNQFASLLEHDKIVFVGWIQPMQITFSDKPEPGHGPGPGFDCSGKCILSLLCPPDKASDCPLMRPVAVTVSSHPYTDPVPPSGAVLARPSGPNKHRNKGAKVTNREAVSPSPLCVMQVSH